MTVDEARILLDAISESRYKSTKWEDDFIESLLESMDLGYNPSPKRSEILQKIYKKSQGNI